MQRRAEGDVNGVLQYTEEFTMSAVAMMPNSAPASFPLAPLCLQQPLPALRARSPSSRVVPAIGGQVVPSMRCGFSTPPGSHRSPQANFEAPHALAIGGQPIQMPPSPSRSSTPPRINAANLSQGTMRWPNTPPASVRSIPSSASPITQYRSPSAVPQIGSLGWPKAAVVTPSSMLEQISNVVNDFEQELSVVSEAERFGDSQAGVQDSFRHSRNLVEEGAGKLMMIEADHMAVKQQVLELENQKTKTEAECDELLRIRAALEAKCEARLKKLRNLIGEDTETEKHKVAEADLRERIRLFQVESQVFQDRLLEVEIEAERDKVATSEARAAAAREESLEKNMRQQNMSAEMLALRYQLSEAEVVRNQYAQQQNASSKTIVELENQVNKLEFLRTTERDRFTSSSEELERLLAEARAAGAHQTQQNMSQSLQIQKLEQQLTDLQISHDHHARQSKEHKMRAEELVQELSNTSFLKSERAQQQKVRDVELSTIENQLSEAESERNRHMRQHSTSQQKVVELEGELEFVRNREQVYLRSNVGYKEMIAELETKIFNLEVMQGKKNNEFGAALLEECARIEGLENDFLRSRNSANLSTTLREECARIQGLESENENLNSRLVDECAQLRKLESELERSCGKLRESQLHVQDLAQSVPTAAALIAAEREALASSLTELRAAYGFAETVENDAARALSAQENFHTQRLEAEVCEFEKKYAQLLAEKQDVESQLTKTNASVVTDLEKLERDAQLQSEISALRDKERSQSVLISELQAAAPSLSLHDPQASSASVRNSEQVQLNGDAENQELRSKNALLEEKMVEIVKIDLGRNQQVASLRTRIQELEHEISMVAGHERSFSSSCNARVGAHVTIVENGKRTESEKAQLQKLSIEYAAMEHQVAEGKSDREKNHYLEGELDNYVQQQRRHLDRIRELEQHAAAGNTRETNTHCVRVQQLEQLLANLQSTHDQHVHQNAEHQEHIDEFIQKLESSRDFEKREQQSAHVAALATMERQLVEARAEQDKHEQQHLGSRQKNRELEDELEALRHSEQSVLVHAKQSEKVSDLENQIAKLEATHSRQVESLRLEMQRLESEVASATMTPKRASLYGEVVSPRAVPIHADELPAIEELPESYKNILDSIRGHGWEAMTWRDNYTMLHWAASKGKVGLCRYLISVNANPRAPDGQGKTPLDFANAAGNADLIDVLKD